MSFAAVRTGQDKARAGTREFKLRVNTSIETSIETSRRVTPRLRLRRGQGVAGQHVARADQGVARGRVTMRGGVRVNRVGIASASVPQLTRRRAGQDTAQGLTLDNRQSKRGCVRRRAVRRCGGC